MVDVNVNHGVGEGAQVGRVEGVEAAGAYLHRPVSPHQLVVKVDADLGDGIITRKDQRVDDVVPAVAPRLKARDLGAGDHHGLAEVLEHEGERGGCVGQRVCAVEDHKAIVEVVDLANVSGHPRPVGHAHIGRVHQVIPLVDGVGNPLDVGDHRKHEHVVIAQSLGRKLLVVECAQGPEVALQLVLGGDEDVFAVPGHADGAARVEDEHLTNQPGVHIAMSRNLH